MRLYEGLFILPPEATVEIRKTQLKWIDGLIEKLKGKIIQKTELGKRPVGYPLKKFKEGYMLVVDFELEPSQQESFRKAIDLQEDILKYMIMVKTPKSEKLPAPKAPARPASTKPQTTVSAPKVPVT